MQQLLHKLAKLRETNLNDKPELVEELQKIENYEINLMLICEDTQINQELRLLALRVISIKRKSRENQSIQQSEERFINQFVHLLPKVIDDKMLLSEYHKVMQTKLLQFNIQFSQQIIQLLSNNINLGCELLKGYCKALQYLLDQERDPLDNMVLQTFPILETYLKENEGKCNNTMAKIFGILRYANYLKVCKYFYDSIKLKQWILYCMALLKAKQDDLIIDNNGSFGKNVFDKCQKLCSQFVLRLNQKYRNQKFCTIDEYKQIGKLFNDVFAIPFMEIFYNLVVQQQHQQSSAVLGNAFKYLHYCMRFENTAKLLFKSFDQLIYQAALPQLLVTDQEVEKWNNAPKQFILQQENIYLDKIKTCQSNSIELISQLIQYKINKKDKNTNLIRFLKDVLQCFNTNFQPFTKTPLTSSAKEAYLKIIQELAQPIRKLKKNKIIEELIELHIIPEFSSENSFLRARVCRVVEIVQLEQQAVKFVPGILQCINDKELPVQVGAVNGLSYLLKFRKVQKIIEPHILDFLNLFFKLIDEIEVENIVQGIQTVIETFPDQVKHFHLQIIDQISNQFQKQKLKNIAGISDEDEYEESEIMLESLCHALTKIIPQESKNYQLIEEKLVPILDYGFTFDGLNLIDFDDSLLLINQLVYYNQNTISDQMWKYFTLFCYGFAKIPEKYAKENEEFVNQLKLFQEFAIESANQIIRTLRNFIQKGGENLFIKSDCFGIKYIDLLINFVQGCITLNSKQEYRNKGFLIFISLIENYFPILGEYFLIIRDISLQAIFNENNERQSQQYAVYTICCCILSMPEMIFELNQPLASFMEILFKYTLKPKGKLEKIILIQFLGQLLVQEKHPQEIQNMYLKIFQSLIQLVVKYKTTKNTDNIEEQNKQNDQEVDQIEKIIKKTNLNEVIENEKDDEAGINSEQWEDEDNSQSPSLKDAIDDDDEDDFDFDDDNERFQYNSQIENVDLTIFIRNILQEFKAKKPDIYQDLFKKLSLEQFEVIQHYLKNSNPMEIEQQ